MKNFECVDRKYIRRECSSLVKIEKMELILFTVGWPSFVRLPCDLFLVMENAKRTHKKMVEKF